RSGHRPVAIWKLPAFGLHKVFLKPVRIAGPMDASVRSVIIMALIFALAQLGAILTISSFLGPEYQAFENPDDPLIPLYYIAAMIMFTFAVLYVIKKKREDVVRIVFLGAVAFTIFYVLLVIAVRFDTGPLALVVPLGLTGAITYYLVVKPEWYVIDAAGILVSIGVIGILGISLSILPVMILLIVLAVYDAVSVYGTKHMVALADGVTKMRLPILLVIPKKWGYSYLSQKPLKQQIEEGGEREAMFMGLGDIIIPGVLIASAFNFLPSGSFSGMDASLSVALGALIGALVGFALLMRYVLKGNPQAGLPLLNGGAIVGYVVAYMIVYGDSSLGISLPW
ncbi:MAG: presenilin family intramembrane aspartyl protease PSH, partial [Thermoplasmata archaeon]